MLKCLVGFVCLPALCLAGSWTTLAGEWRFALDPRNEGIAQRWFDKSLDDRISLPGTTDEAHKGKLNEARETERLTRLYPYVGAAWYQRDITVPADWAGQRAVLVLERTKTTRLWVDGQDLGVQNSLVAPHYYTLGDLKPGRHQVTLRIDNTAPAPIGDPHQISDQTQTNWNGVIGRIGVRLTPKVWIEDVQVYPDVAQRRIRVRIEVGNATGRRTSGKLVLEAGAGPLSIPFSVEGERGVAEASYSLGAAAREWDEFTPAISRLSVALDAQGLRDQRDVPFGFRDFKAKGTQFAINGRTTFLRGKVDNCVFPLTGYPPMTVDGWLRVFKIAKEYGINHYRFHTWTPPEAAFEAADQSGVYLQPELPNWAEYGKPEHDDFLRAEGERILREYGNHPSFVMLSLGNELGGKQALMAPFVQHFRALDARHLYAQGTNNWFSTLAAGDDYWASFQVGGKKIRGSFATVDAPLGHVQTGPPATTKDYAAEIAGIPVPVVSHEIGEYQVFPDFREIAQYTGVLRARNLEIFRERLAKAGMLDQAGAFVNASGASVVLSYREDIEAALRTPGFGGFQVLDFQDFPGQGTALVGILNAFMESKGLADPARWREFCAATVPLLRLGKFTYTTGETLTARAEVAHYGPAAMPGAVPVWTLRDATGHALATGRLASRDIPQGGLAELGAISLALKDIPAPAKVQLELALEGTPYRNSYDLWVYPPAAEPEAGAVLVRRTLDPDTRRALAAGAKVLLLPAPSSLTKSLGGSFAPDFWNYGMFRKLAEDRKAPVAPGTLGILTDPAHPALRGFPSESYANWQWFHLLMGSRAVVLDAMPAGYRPLVQVIDNAERGHRLGAIFELRVGQGKLLVCSIDLPGMKDKPEARQLLRSLLGYMNSAEFSPATPVDEMALRGILE
jgi:hypothetical protein